MLTPAPDSRVDEVHSDPESTSTQKTYFPPSTEVGTMSKIRRHMLGQVRTTSLGEAELVLLTLFTGIQDAVSFPEYHCFASNQTGNTVLLMLAIIVPEFNGQIFQTVNVGAALGFFLLAGWLTGQIGHIVGPRLRIWLICCNFLQSVMVLAAGFIQLRIVGSGSESGATVAVVALLAFASGSQVVQSRALAMTEISTAMATAAWVDLVIDPKLFHIPNKSRTRRVAFLVALALGSLLGAGVYRTAGSAAALFVSSAGKFLVTFMYLLNEEERPEVEDVEKATRAQYLGNQ